MRDRRGPASNAATIALVLAGVLAVQIAAARGAAAGAQAPGRGSIVSTVPVTPVEGLSTLHQLRITIEQSSMGWAGQWSPPSSAVAPGADAARSEPRGGPFVLTGADLYRISCRSCHKADGTGNPPEINSLLGPVQAASADWMTADMKARGRDVSPAFIRQLTSATESDLRTRLKQGGHDMPAFGQISDQEYGVLRPYLDDLAGLRKGQPARRTITEPSIRVGELIAKGTCHICHDATNSSQAPTTVLSGVIPSLASMPHEKTFAEFVRKVRQGSPIPLGSAGVSSRGRMPVFDYLTEQEVSATYAYLTTYPPR